MTSDVTKLFERLENIARPYRSGIDFDGYPLWVQEMILLNTFFTTMVNGTFAYFISDNTVGNKVGALKSVLRKIGAVKGLKIVEDFERLFPDGCIPEEEGHRMESYFEIEKKYPLETKGYETSGYLKSGENIARLFIEYLEVNKIIAEPKLLSKSSLCVEDQSG